MVALLLLFSALFCNEDFFENKRKVYITSFCRTFDFPRSKILQIIAVLVLDRGRVAAARGVGEGDAEPE